MKLKHWKRFDQNYPSYLIKRGQRFIKKFGLSAYDSSVLTAQKDIAEYFEQCVEASGGEAKLCANWVMGELSAALNRENIDIKNSPVNADQLGWMITRIKDNTISGKIAKQVFDAMWTGEGTADQIIENKGLKQMSDSGELEKLVDEVINNNPDQVEQYRNSPEDKQKKLIGFFCRSNDENDAG